jgi:hypothetical protein
MNPVHILTPYFFKINFIIILSSMSMFPSVIFPFSFLTNFVYISHTKLLIPFNYGINKIRLIISRTKNITFLSLMRIIHVAQNFLTEWTQDRRERIKIKWLMQLFEVLGMKHLHFPLSAVACSNSKRTRQRIYWTDTGILGNFIFLSMT